MVRKKPLNLIIIIVLLFASESYGQVTSFAIDSSKFNKKLMKILNTIHNNDQAGRQKLGVLIKSNASKAAKDSLWRRIRETDREDLKQVSLILDKYGWQGPQDVGIDASETLFLVIQHADLATQEKYLPVVRDAEKNGKTLSSNLALLEDRIAMRTKQLQSYGSQTFTDKITGQLLVYPIADPDHLDERRKRMGLPPMADYMKVMNIDWDLNRYKLALPDIEKAAEQLDRQ